MNKRTDYHDGSGNYGVSWDELFQIWLSLDARIYELYCRASAPCGQEDRSEPAKMNAWDADCYQVCCELWVDVTEIIAIRSYELHQVVTYETGV